MPAIDIDLTIDFRYWWADFARAEHTRQYNTSDGKAKLCPMNCRCDFLQNTMDCCLKMIDVLLKLMEFILKMMDFIPKVIDVLLKLMVALTKNHD